MASLSDVNQLLQLRHDCSAYRGSVTQTCSRDGDRMESGPYAHLISAAKPEAAPACACDQREGGRL
jgi:hypothetical protein